MKTVIKMSIKYFAEFDLRTNEPMGLYRFFDGENKPPESLKDNGWIPVPSLWYSRSSGEITDDDEINAQEAREIAAKWGYNFIQLNS